MPKMKIMESLEEQTKAVEEATEVEAKAQPVDDLAEPKVADEPKDDPKDVAQDGGADDKADKKPKEEKPEEVFYRKRKEEKALREELEETRRRLAQLENGPKADPKANEDPEPDPSDEIEHTKWELRQTKKKLAEIDQWREEKTRQDMAVNTRSAAENAFSSYEAQVRGVVDDYDAAAAHYVNVQAIAIKTLYPNITPQQLQNAVKTRILTRAAELEREGYENPVAVMYEEAKQMGYKKADPKANEEKPGKEEPKPDLDKIAANKARSAGMAGASGHAKNGVVTANAAASMSVREWANLPLAEKQAIFRELGTK